MTWQHKLAADFGLDAAQISSFERLMHLVRERSDRSLTAVISPKSIVNIHFRDSLSLLSFEFVTKATSAVDVGSGAGFPGIPLAIALPHLELVMLEANKAKCAFINDAIAALGLDNARAFKARAEDAGRSELRDFFDVAFARAVGPLAVTLEYVLPLVKPGGHALLQRGARLEGEAETAASVSGQLNASIYQVTQVKPYPEANNLHIWLFKKDKPTPVKFPRKAGLAKKRPLE